MEAYTGVDVLEVMDGAKNYNAFLTDLIVAHSPGKKVLDFGAGSGAFARFLKRRGFDVTCIEPDAHLRSGLTREGFRAYSSLADCREKFNYIYAVNVLEHIEDDLACTQALYMALADGGRLFIYVPAFMSLYSAFDKKIGHFRRYTKASLLATVPQFRVDLCHYVDSLGFVAAWLFKYVGGKDGSVSLTAVRVFDSLVFPLSRVLDLLLRPFFGKNVLLVAQKR